MNMEKLVGAKKRKPININKFHQPAGSESEMMIPEEEEKPYIIKSILSELKSGVLSRQQKCGYCFQQIRKSNISSHFRKVHHSMCTNSIPLSCSNCDVVLSSTAHLQNHMATVHYNNPMISNINSEYNVVQDEPLDLSVDAVDLSIKNQYEDRVLFNKSYQQHDEVKKESSVVKLLPCDLSSGAPTTTTTTTTAADSSSLRVSMGMNSVVTISSIVDFNNSDINKKKGKSKKTSEGNNNKPKQRRYRTERPFVCPHCGSTFTLRSNMERHGKHQHPTVWQRSPSNRTLNKQKLLKANNIQTPTSDSNSAIESDHIRTALSAKLKRKLSMETVDTEKLASVEKILKLQQQIPMSQQQNESDQEEESYDDDYAEDNSEDSSNCSEKKMSAYSSAPHKISCPHCTRRFPWTSSLRRHLLTHTGQKPFQCSRCPLLFTTKSNCDRHLVRKHSHIDSSNTVDNNAEVGKVETDNEDDSPKEGFSHDIVDDDGEGEKIHQACFRCHLCEDLTSPQRDEILSHMESVHPEVFIELSKSIIQQQEEQLVPDDNSISNNRKVVCAFCLRRFWSVEDLRRHMRSHTGERPFTCQFCDRRFTLKHSMLRHLKKHNH